MNNVLGFPAASTNTVEQCIDSLSEVREDLSDVLVCGYFKDSGTLFVRSSRMTRADALWLSEMLREHALDMEE